ncbi:helix-turn-helix transcriptional regulator [Planomicrobium sp. CPCC 101079]|uniref:helix-turn-helix domain-containing protein n=1 Tax=Planomicrobium sp. CPCC 101079 TaxID=2599618 RepID=UPI0011B75857|nr:helix-turn-helix transcriptional regulator [Planomicrobium sp. CPCC 101079]TWT04634.1 helix-turn-helix transcriptional regulator [Planomicrobium sp. CPCC 101079]
MREIRGEKTQQQMALDFNLSREAYSKMENGSRKVQADIALRMMERGDNARFAFELRHQYTNTGPRWLDGPNVDLHHASVKEKTLEELEEAMKALREFNLARSLKSISHWERPEAEKVLEEMVEAVTALEHMVAILCENLEISFVDTWQNHYLQLKAKGWLS